MWQMQPNFRAMAPRRRGRMGRAGSLRGVRSVQGRGCSVRGSSESSTVLNSGIPVSRGSFGAGGGTLRNIGDTSGRIHNFRGRMLRGWGRGGDGGGKTSVNTDVYSMGEMNTSDSQCMKKFNMERKNMEV